MKNFSHSKLIAAMRLTSLMLIVALVSTIGCNTGGSPSKVTRQFFAAVEKGDVKTYSELSTPETAQIIVMFGEKAKGSIIAKGGIVSTEETINGDTAVVEITFKDGSKEKLDFKKIDGKWKVDMKTNK